MKIKSILAKNFMSFRTLNFSVPDAGLHFVSGEVVGKDMANSNGAGKSALFEALCFCLYGKTIRGAGKDSIVNRTAGKDCCVAVEIEKTDGDYVIMRYRKDSENDNELALYKGDANLTLGTATATQDLIDHVIGMNWLVFSTAIIFGEQARRFTEAKDSEKKQIFDEILMLHRFQEAQKAVRDDIKTYEDKVSTIDIAVASSSSLLDQKKEDLAEEHERLVEAQKAQKKTGARIKELKTSRQTHRASKEQFNKELETSNNNLADLESQQDVALNEINSLREKEQAEIKPFNEKIRDINVDMGVLAESMKTINAKLDEGFGDLQDGAECPLCYGQIDVKNFVRVKKHYEKELEVKTQELDAVSIKYKDFTDAGKKIIDDYNKKIEKVTNVQVELETVVADLKSAGASLSLKIGAEEEILKSINKEIELIKGYSEMAVNDVEKRIEDNNTQIKALEKEMDGYIKQKDDVLYDITYLKFWVIGFGNQGIKSLLLDEIVPELNMRVSQYASALMDDNMQIIFDTEATLKSGETRDKFNVKIQQADQDIQYEDCSSGEKARIDVSILLALQSMVFNRSANNSNMVIFDEVFEHLDIVGIERTVNLLKEEAEDKAIFVISHQNELRDYFDNQIIIENKNGESRLGE